MAVRDLFLSEEREARDQRVMFWVFDSCYGSPTHPPLSLSVHFDPIPRWIWLVNVPYVHTHALEREHYMTPYDTRASHRREDDCTGMKCTCWFGGNNF